MSYETTLVLKTDTELQQEAFLIEVTFAVMEQSSRMVGYNLPPDDPLLVRLAAHLVRLTEEAKARRVYVGH